jgi:molybdenum cofactor synthesis domain-containing protein
MEATGRRQQEVSRARVITVSDGAFHGHRQDTSGPALIQVLQRGGFEVDGPEVVPDEKEHITNAINSAVSGGVDVVVTTGGTGLGPRDVTPQATAALIEFEVPGIAEEMRRAGAANTPMAALSRGIAGVRERTLIINVPGSPKGATESLAAVLPILAHAVQLLHGDTQHK